jgi:hypothetical protein
MSLAETGSSHKLRSYRVKRGVSQQSAAREARMSVALASVIERWPERADQRDIDRLTAAINRLAARPHLRLVHQECET